MRFLELIKKLIIDPTEMFSTIHEEKISQLLCHIILVYLISSLLGVSVNLILNFRNYSIIGLIYGLFGYILIWILLSFSSMFLIAIFMRRCMSEKLKKELKEGGWESVKWANLQLKLNFKIIGYGMIPLIFFTQLGILVFTPLYYLSWYWILISTIGASHTFKISKVEAFISLLIAYILTIGVSIQPLRMVMSL